MYFGLLFSGWLFLASCSDAQNTHQNTIQNQPKAYKHELQDTLPASTDFASRLSNAAIELTSDDVQYDATYFKIPYPNGDVPTNKGVCTDVVIRAYRKLGVDLQQEVHKDMVANFSLYPQKWKLKKTDTNIDHRRVPNLMTFFSRHGTSKKITNMADDYLPGDIVTWNLGQGLTHIGIIVNQKSNDGQRCLIVHNIGQGQVLADCLFSFKITGHYAYNPQK